MKTYKINQILNKNFLGKTFMDTICEDKYRVVNPFDNLYSLIDTTNGVYIEDNIHLMELLTTDFILLDSDSKEIKEKNFYIAGSLFSEAEVNQRLKEEKELRELGFNNIYNPISADINDKSSLPTSADIFWGDTLEILSSDIVIADLSNASDLGVSCEMGIVWSCNHLHRLAKDGLTLEEILEEMKEKKIVAHLSDIRKSTSHLYKGNNSPWGYNAYVMGCVEDVGVVKDNFKEVLEELKGEVINE